MSADVAVYLDSSALVKLVVREPETAALERFLERDEVRVSSILARTEVVRAVRMRGPQATSRARRVLDSLSLIDLDATLADYAARIEPVTLRSLDSVHLAAAVAVREEIAALVTYDRRMAGAAIADGFVVESPGYSS